MRAWCFSKKPAPDPELEDLKAELAAALPPKEDVTWT